MDKPILIYCYDAYCGWCYGFSAVMKRIAEEYKDRFDFDVLSGGMMLSPKPAHVSAIAGFVSKAYKNVEERTGIKFGEDFLWHMRNPDQSDWFPDSEKSAIAMSIFKEIYPERQVEFASDLQYSLNYEGRDLTDDEAYRHLLDKYSIDTEVFYSKLHSSEYKDKAHYEFAMVKQLQVTGFPAVLAQVSDSKFYLLARGYTDYDTFKQRLENLLAELATTV